MVISMSEPIIQNDETAVKLPASNAPKRRGIGRPFKAGDHGNPHGRPRIYDSYADTVRGLLKKEFNDLTVTPMTCVQTAICIAQIRAAVKGDVSAARELIDRAYGKVTDKIEVNNTTPSKVVFEEVRLVASQTPTALNVTTQSVLGSRPVAQLQAAKK